MILICEQPVTVPMALFYKIQSGDSGILTGNGVTWLTPVLYSLISKPFLLGQ